MKVALIWLLAIAVLMLSTCGGNVVLNNWRLDKFSAQLFKFPIPDGAEVIKTESKLGVLTGNGNHCDFLASLTIRGSLNIDRIKGHYGSLEIAPAIQGCEAEQHLLVESQMPKQFTVQIFDAPNTRWLDPRCT